MAMLLQLNTEGNRVKVLFVGVTETDLIKALGVSPDEYMTGLRAALPSGEMVQLTTDNEGIQIKHLDDKGDVARTESTRDALLLKDGGLIIPMCNGNSEMQDLIHRLNNQDNPLGFLAYLSK